MKELKVTKDLNFDKFEIIEPIIRVSANITEGVSNFDLSEPGDIEISDIKYFVKLNGIEIDITSEVRITLSRQPIKFKQVIQSIENEFCDMDFSNDFAMELQKEEDLPY